MTLCVCGSCMGSCMYSEQVKIFRAHLMFIASPSESTIVGFTRCDQEEARRGESSTNFCASVLKFFLRRKHFQRRSELRDGI